VTTPRRLNLNETGRIISLAVATLFGEGVANPREHLFLAAGFALPAIVGKSASVDGGRTMTVFTSGDYTIAASYTMFLERFLI
jgi:hypothetical protein